jgi:hypothetical protein
MSPTRFLKITLPSILIPALIVLILPAGVWPTYVDIMQPLALFIGSFLALYVSFAYRKQLRVAFIFLSAFLFIYMLAIILFLSCSPILLPHLKLQLGEAEIFRLIQGVQLMTYSMLFLFCINLLKVVNVTQLNRTGWTIFSLAFVFCLLVTTYPILDLIRTISSIELAGILYIMIRIFDAALIIVMVPVLWLYIQHLKSRQRQSLTFTVIIFGIVCSTILDYLFESIVQVFPRLLASGSPLYLTIPKVLFIYGYLTIAVGLYAHRKQDEWGYNTIDKTMTSKLKPADAR